MHAFGVVVGSLVGGTTAGEVKARGYNLDITNPHVVADQQEDPEELLARLDASEAEASALSNQLKSILETALLR